MASRSLVRKPEPESRELESVSLKTAALRIGEFANEAGYGNRIRPLTRRGKLIAAIVGKKDLQRLRDLDASAA